MLNDWFNHIRIHGTHSLCRYALYTIKKLSSLGLTYHIWGKVGGGQSSPIFYILLVYRGVMFGS